MPTVDELLRQAEAQRRKEGARIWPKVQPLDPPYQGQTSGHPYFCLHCRTIEVYDVVPQQDGQAMLPWHAHEGAHILLRPMNPDEVARILRQGGKLTHAVSSARKAAPRGPKPLTPLANPAADRLAAVLAKVKAEGW